MIQTQRAYELNSKAIQTSDQMLQKPGASCDAATHDELIAAPSAALAAAASARAAAQR